MRRVPTPLGVARFLAFFVWIALSACQTTGDGSPATAGNDAEIRNRVSKSFYTPFFDQGDHLAKLVEAGEFGDASKLFAEQRDFFNRKRDDHRQVLATVAGHFNATADERLRLADQALKNVRWPLPPGDWADLRGALVLAKSAIDTYPKHAILDDAEFRSSWISVVDTARSNLVSRIRESAAEQFREYDHFGETGFFDVYPINVKSPGFMRKNFPALEPKLGAVDTDRLKAFSRHFTRADTGDAAWKRLGNRYLKAVLAEGDGPGKPDMNSALEALSKAKEAGFEPNRIPGLDIAFVEITSRTLLKQGQVEFPVAVDVDLPVETVRAELDKALIDHTAQFSDYTIILDVALAKSHRRVTGTKKMPARILAGYRTEPNPEYRLVENEVAEARMAVQNAALDSASVNSQYCQGLGCFGKAIAQIAAGAARGKAQDGLKAAMQKLRATPMTLEIPVYQKYRYDKATVKSAKLMTVHYYVVDRANRELFKSTFDIEEERSFDVAYGIHEDDPDGTSHRSSSDSEGDVVAWEEGAASVALSQLVRHYLDSAGEKRPLPRLTDLREEMLRDKNQALAHYREQTFEGSTQADPRFDSVVVIYTLDGALGTGFFVRPDVVMTNHHVVEEGEFVEMKMYGGQETFGKVIARDVRIDLALIRVQARGKPVDFYVDNKLALGSTVEVIGHPRGLEYAITRGVVSAVRMMESPNIGSSKKFLQVQIDAATSPGNSGGPVFLKNKVAGVVSWGRIDRGSENLNFTIHYSEANRFLTETLGMSS
jgi:serine protease Do